MLKYVKFIRRAYIRYESSVEAARTFFFIPRANFSSDLKRSCSSRRDRAFSPFPIIFTRWNSSGSCSRSMIVKCKVEFRPSRISSYETVPNVHLNSPRYFLLAQAFSLQFINVLVRRTPTPTDEKSGAQKSLLRTISKRCSRREEGEEIAAAETRKQLA